MNELFIERMKELLKDDFAIREDTEDFQKALLNLFEQ